MFQDVKIFDLEGNAPGTKKFRSKSSILRFGESQGHGISMLKALNSKFLNQKTSNSKLLTSWAMSQDIKIFDLEVHAPATKKFWSKYSSLKFGMTPGC